MGRVIASRSRLVGAGSLCALTLLGGCTSPEAAITGTAEGRAKAASVTADGTSKPPVARAVAVRKPSGAAAAISAAPLKRAEPTATPAAKIINPAIEEARRTGAWSVSPDGKSLPPRSRANGPGTPASN